LRVIIDNIKDKFTSFRKQFYCFLKGEFALPYPEQEDYIKFLENLVEEFELSQEKDLPFA